MEILTKFDEKSTINAICMTKDSYFFNKNILNEMNFETDIKNFYANWRKCKVCHEKASGVEKFSQ